MGTDNWLVNDNPISQARKLEGWSLEKLGKRLGLSKQYLSRAEHGTYMALNRNVARWAANVLELSVNQVERDYEAFQKAKRKATAENLAPKLLSRESRTAPGSEIFRDWRESLWNTPLSFAKDLCVHPVNVENYEEGMLGGMPAQIEDALREVKLLDPNWSEDPVKPPRRVEALRADLRGPFPL